MSDNVKIVNPKIGGNPVTVSRRSFEKVWAKKGFQIFGEQAYNEPVEVSEDALQEETEEAPETTPEPAADDEQQTSRPRLRRGQ